MESRSDEDIARRVQAGESALFGTLVERYEAKLLRYARKFLLLTDDAKDVVQEVFMKAYANMRGFDASKRFSPWIYRIAHNEFVNAGKKRQALRLVPLMDFDELFPHPTAPENPESDAERSELRRMLDGCLAKIGGKYREALVLRYFEEMDYREIADVLAVPVSTVGIRLKRGKALLAELVKGKI